MKFEPLWKPQTFLIFLCNMLSNSILRNSVSFWSLIYALIVFICACFLSWETEFWPFLNINQACRVKSLFQCWHSFACLVYRRFQYTLIIFMSDICGSSTLRIFSGVFSPIFFLKGKFYVNFTRKTDTDWLVRVKRTVVTWNSWARWRIVLVWNKFQKDAISQK